MSTDTTTRDSDRRADEAQDDTDQQSDNASSQSQNDDGQNQQDDQEQGHNALEWIVGIVGALIVLGTIGFITLEIIRGVGGPPNVQVSLGTPVDKGNEMMVPIEVKNEGGSVAADAVIEVCAGLDECAQITFNYVPHESSRKGMVGFAKPLTGPLTTRVVSYRTP